MTDRQPHEPAAGPGDAPQEPLRVTDRRRVDPVTGAVRAQPGAAPAPPAGMALPGDQPGDERLGDEQLGDEVDTDIDVAAALVAEVTADLQRVHAEYANYRKRVERDRELVRDQAVAGTLAELLPVLDDIGRAREHGELEGGFRSVGEALEAAVQRLGLEAYGEVGEPFDPAVHEALTHEHRDDVTEPTCVAVYQPGYRFAGRVVRAARVGVADPEGE